MFKCECYPNHEICKNQKTCELKMPLTGELQLLYRQLSWELEKLKDLKQRKQEYFEILSEIRQGVYTETVSINGKLQQVPKKNFLGEHITRPEHVQVGLNYNDLMLEIQDQESIIRTLRFKEHSILTTLKNK